MANLENLNVTDTTRYIVIIKKDDDTWYKFNNVKDPRKMPVGLIPDDYGPLWEMQKEAEKELESDVEIITIPEPGHMIVGTPKPKPKPEKPKPEKKQPTYGGLTCPVCGKAQSNKKLPFDEKTLASHIYFAHPEQRENQ